MKSKRNLWYCFLACLLCIVSCSKEKLNLATDQQPQSSKKTASVSSIVSYAKDNTTTVTKLESDKVGGVFPKYVVYSIGPLTVEAADVVSAHLQRELTWTGTDEISTNCGIVVATSATCRDNTDPGFLGMLSPFCGNNLVVGAEGSSEILTRTGSYQFAAASSSIYINAVFYAASLGTSIDMDLPVGNNYGELVSVVERGIQRYSSTTHHSPYGAWWFGTGYAIPIGGTQYIDNSIGPLTIAPNTMVDIRYQTEVTANITNGTDPAQTLGRKTIYTTSATSTSGTNFTSPSQHGITKYERHDVSSHAGGAFFGSTGATGAYFNSVVWSYGGTGSPLQVENGGSASLLYGSYAVETRPYVYFAQDLTRNITAVSSTPQVLYSVGPLDIDANQVVEIRYVGAFGAPASLTPFNSSIIRATSPTATTGVTVQPALYRKYGPAYVYNQAIHSTAERPTTALTGQYYNVVVTLPSGGSLPVIDWGELEVVKR